MSSTQAGPEDPLSLPSPRTPDPAQAPALRWGVISPGHIAGQFTATLHRATRSHVVGVVSRSIDRARAFAAEHGIDGAFDAVSDMLTASGLDAVYIASPHAQHLQLARPVIEAGVPVLVEKSFTLNEGEAVELLDLARQRGVFAMEAMWARFLPQYDVLRQLLESGRLGEVVTVLADHGQWFPPDPTHRLHDPALGGGALLDLGVYPVSLAQMVLGDLTDVAITGELTDTGVDASVAMVARGARGGHTLLSTTLRSRTPNEAAICGTLGRVRLSAPFYAPGTLTLEMNDGRTASFTHPGDTADGMAFEAAEAARSIRAGRLESPLMTWADTLSVMRTADAVRAALGIVYPTEARA